MKGSLSRKLAKNHLPENWIRILDLVLILVRRELKVKYRGSVLGYCWSMLNPLLFMMTISVVFSFLVKGIPSYPLFVLSGILFWNLTTNSLSVGAQSILGGASLIRKIKMPIWILPTVPVFTFASNFLLALIPYCLVYLTIGPKDLPAIGMLPIVLLLYLVFLTGLCLVISTLNVFFRDIGHVIEPILIMLMYATPVIYDRSQPMIPERVRFLIGLNPFTHFIEAGRKSIYGGSEFALSEIGLLFIFAVASLSVGCLVFYRLRSRIIFAL